MEFRLTINLDNAAFQVDERSNGDNVDYSAIRSTVESAMKRMDETDMTEGIIRDINGNKIGRWWIDA